MSNRLAIVLAAGKGTRMESDLPKVLVEICGRPMIRFVVDALAAADIDAVCVVVGYRGDEVRRALSDQHHVTFVDQEPQLGTGHAVMVCREHLLGREGPVAILTGDSPLVIYVSLIAVSVVFSAFVDNIPYITTMIPLVRHVAEGVGVNEVPLIFGMILGASLGGNITPFGASANVVAVGLLRKEGYQVSTREFLKIGLPFTLVATAAGAAFLWLVWR